MNLAMEMPAPAFNLMISTTFKLWPFRVIFPIIVDIITDFPGVFEDPGPQIHSPDWFSRVNIAHTVCGTMTFGDIKSFVPAIYPPDELSEVPVEFMAYKGVEDLYIFNLNHSPPLPAPLKA